MKHRARVWKKRTPFARKPWRAKCSCMDMSGLEFHRETWGEAFECATNHMRRIHPRVEAIVNG